MSGSCKATNCCVLCAIRPQNCACSCSCRCQRGTRPLLCPMVAARSSNSSGLPYPALTHKLHHVNLSQLQHLCATQLAHGAARPSECRQDEVPLSRRGVPAVHCASMWPVHRRTTKVREQCCAQPRCLSRRARFIRTCADFGNQPDPRPPAGGAAPERLA